MHEERLTEIRSTVRERRLRYDIHTAARMRQHGIQPNDLRAALLHPAIEVIEDYPDDARGLLPAVILDQREIAPHRDLDAAGAIRDHGVLAGYPAREMGRGVSEACPMSEKPRRCPVCGGDMEEGTTTFTSVEDARPIIVERVPALVCASCGEAAISDDVLDVLARLPDQHVTPTRLLTVPVFTFDLAKRDLATVSTAR